MLEYNGLVAHNMHLKRGWASCMNARYYRIILFKGVVIARRTIDESV